MGQVKAKDIEKFRAWLFEFGLSEGTVDIYSHDIDKAFREGGLMDRLRDDELAPKTRRHILAAVRHWGEYTSDAKLLMALKRLRLPSPQRKVAKTPIERDELFALMDEIEAATYLDDPMRAELGLMAARGFRCGDVLRLRKREIVSALRTGTLAYEGKGRRRLEFSVIPTYRRFLEILPDYPGWDRVEDLIAPRSSPGKLRRRAASKAAARALTACADQVGIDDIYPHRLRRTYAVEYLRAMKTDPEAVVKLQQHMQWASLATAMQYVDHHRGAELDVAAEAMWAR